MKDPAKPTSYSAVTQDYRNSLAAAKRQMDESDDPVLLALGRKPYAMRALRIGPEIRRLDVELMNRPMPELENTIEKVFTAVLGRFEKAAGAKAE
jgi:hypothetical protein